MKSMKAHTALYNVSPHVSMSWSYYTTFHQVSSAYRYSAAFIHCTWTSLCPKHCHSSWWGVWIGTSSPRPRLSVPWCLALGGKLITLFINLQLLLDINVTFLCLYSLLDRHRNNLSHLVLFMCALNTLVKAFSQSLSLSKRPALCTLTFACTEDNTENIKYVHASLFMRST